MLLLHTLLLILAATVPLTAHGQSYPSRPIRIIIPFPPGNTLDIMTRLIGPKLTERLGQNVIVDNRAGASGMLGLELAMNAPRDGYTLVGGQGGNLVVAPIPTRRSHMIRSGISRLSQSRRRITWDWPYIRACRSNRCGT